MNKKDLLLAQKVIAARRVKQELEELRSPKNLSSSRPFTSSGKSSSSSSSSLLLPAPFSPVQTNKVSFFGTNDNNNASDNNTTTIKNDEMILTREQQEIVQELGNRSMTDKAALRKKQTSVTKKLHSKFGASSIKFDDNYFMPKVTKSRADGATLMDVYESKKADTWGRIIKSQYIEDEANKIKAYQNKLQANENFGKKLRAQLDDNHQRFLAQMGKDDYLRDIVEASSKASDDIQRKKREDAKKRDILFMELAKKDVEIKKKRQEAELLKDMEAGHQMISKSNYLKYLDDKKAQDKKDHLGRLQEQLMKENEISLRMKEEERLRIFAEERKINAEAIRRAEALDKQRADDLAAMLRMASDGPAHQMYREVKKIAADKDQRLYSTLCDTENPLSKAMLASEDASKARDGATGAYLKKDWDMMMKIHADEAKEEGKRVAAIGVYMQNKIKESYKEDEQNFLKKKAAHKKYQQDLDYQLNIVRKRSLDTLTKTMSDREISLNRDLLRKSGVNV